MAAAGSTPWTASKIRRPGSDGPGQWQFALPSDFSLLKGGMHYGGCHCHARGERETGKTDNRTPSDIHSVAVPMQQSAVKPILSPASFRYALIQPSITEIKNRAAVAQTFDQTRESIRC